jgi:sugar phosphate isomerase/epimerase
MPPFTCFSTIGCPEKSLPEVLSFADRHGIPFVEIRTLQMREDLPALFEKEYGDPARMEAVLARHRARPLIWGSSYKLAGSDSLAGLESLIPWLKPCAWLRVMDGGKFGQTLTDKERKQCLRCLRRTNEQLAAAGLSTRVIIETHDVFARPDECRRMIDAADGEFDLLWDSHHTWHRGGLSSEACWKLLGPWTRHIHVKDSHSGPDGFHYTLPGRGDFDFRALFNILRENGYSGAVSLEWEKRWHPELPSLEAAFTACMPMTR